jgi:Tetracyclin repressor-like, C-terminal domain
LPFERFYSRIGLGRAGRGPNGETCAQACIDPKPNPAFDAELELHVAYYREHPSAARLWMGSRTSATVANQVHARMRTLAERIHAILVNAKLIPTDTDLQALLVAVEMGDRVLELAYRNGDEDFDQTILDFGRRALIAYGQELANA